MKIAIGYHGLIRGFKYEFVSTSHNVLLLDVLHKAGYEVDIFIHTFDKDFDKSIYSLKPKNIIIESDKQLSDSLDWINTYKFPSYFPDELCINYFKDMYTRKCVFSMIESSAITYDWVIFVNPGQLFKGIFPNISVLDNKYIYIPDHSHNGGYNGRFALGGMSAMKVYSSVYDILYTNRFKPIYMSNRQQDIHNEKGAVNIHPETSIKYILNNAGYYPVERGHLIHSFEVIRVRTNGSIV